MTAGQLAPGPRLRRRMAGGATVRSTFVKLGALEVIDVLAGVGLDAVIVDLEHSQLGEDDARRLLRHAAALGCPALVRVAEVDRPQINRLLEAGAAGIQLSSVTCRRQVDDLVNACRYPPAGTRSVSLAQPAAGYGAEGLARYLAAQNGGPLVVVQVETAATADPLPHLVRGVDVVFAGLTDLSVDLGVPGSLDAPEVLARLDELVAALDSLPESDRPRLGGWIPSFSGAAALEERGARYLTAGSDLAALAGALRATFGGDR